MPTPSTPTLSLVRNSSTSFTATITGDAGVTHRLFYRNLSASVASDVTGPTRVGNGTIPVSALSPEAHYQVWVISDNGSLSAPRISSISLVSTDDVLGAIKSKWYGSPVITTAIPGGLFLSEVPETLEGTAVPLPYAYAEVGSTEFLWTMTEKYKELSDITFVVFAAGAASARNCVKEIRSVFDDSILSFNDGVSTSTFVRPSRMDITSEPIRHKDGSLIYRATLVYEYFINRSYPIS